MSSRTDVRRVGRSSRTRVALRTRQTVIFTSERLVFSRRTTCLHSSYAFISNTTELDIPVEIASVLTLITINTVDSIRESSYRRSQASAYISA